MPRQEKIGHRIFAYLSDSKTKPPQTKDRAITLISEYLEFDCWRFCKRSLLQYFGQFYSGLPLSPAPSPKKVEREPDEVPFPAWVAPRASATGSVEAVRFDRVEIQRPHPMAQAILRQLTLYTLEAKIIILGNPLSIGVCSPLIESFASNKPYRWWIGDSPRW